MKPIKESDLAYAVTDLLYKLEGIGWLTFFHVPNGGKNKPQYAAKLKKMGVRAGAPDYVIFLKGGKTLFVELKRGDGRVSPAQDIFHQILNRCGFAVHVVKTDDPGDAAKQVLDIVMEARG